jgi:ABC-2 type transport system ATP-binding protein
MSEMAMTADHVIVVGRGRLLRDQPMADFIENAAVESVRVRTPALDQLTHLLEQDGATVTRTDGALVVEGLSSDHIGTVAAHAQITLLELSPRSGSLEDAYLALTRGAVDHGSGVEAHDDQHDLHAGQGVA